jgi:hypothetical protein
VAQANGARLHGGSGNGPTKKNDSHSDRFLFENKRTDNKRQISIKETDLRDLRNQAALEGREPVLSFELNGRDYYVITDHLWAELTDG